MQDAIEELTGRQRFELALFCVEVEEPGSNMVETFASIIRFAAAEGLTVAMFSKRDRSGYSLLHAATAVGILRNPDDYPPESLGGRALAAAGIEPEPNP